MGIILDCRRSIRIMSVGKHASAARTSLSPPHQGDAAPLSSGGNEEKLAEHLAGSCGGGRLPWVGMARGQLTPGSCVPFTPESLCPGKGAK